jgi:hypothetical protein
MLLLVIVLGARAGACAGDVVLNELFPNPAGADDDAEWVELYNAGPSAVALAGWTLRWGTSALSAEASLGAVDLPPGGFLVVGGPLSGAAVTIEGLGMGNASGSGDAVALDDCAGRRVDTVVYGPDNRDGFVDDAGVEATSQAPSPRDDTSIARRIDGLDTDRAGDDFVLLEVPTPGASNAHDDDCAGASDVKINELLPDPDGADAGAEWIELVHTGADPVALDGWWLEWGTSDFDARYDFAAGTTMQPGDLLVVGADVSLTLGNAGSSADAVRLRHCGGGVSDTVVYGPYNSDGWIDDGGAVATALAPGSAGGVAIARRVDGADSDDCATDFGLAPPTPGESNAVSSCVPGDRTLTINELLPDPEGEDDGAEWIEIHHAGASDQPLAGWTIEIAKSDWTDLAYAFPDDASIGAGGFLVVADDGAGLSLGNASAAPDGVRLVDCEGAVQDTVLYADPLDELEEPLLDDLGGTTVAAIPHESLSLGRIVDGRDTDDNARDFLEDLPPTPGSPNDVGTGNGVPVPKACLAPGGTCGTGALPTSGGAALLAWMAVRRRRPRSGPMDNSVEDG